MWWFFRQDKNQVVCNTFLCIPKSTEIDITKNPVLENITEFVWVTPKDFLSDKFNIDNESLRNIIKLV
jgi:hypothetical protein